jgi:E3 ubiquitin-protein ligase MYCBP2
VACIKKKPCGHRCGGFKDEEKCLPCLNEDCAKKGAEEEERKGEIGLFDGVNADTYCTICHISGLGAEPAVQLGCGHIFHFNCVKNLLEKKWVTPRITFNFMNCPSCKKIIDCKHSPVLQELFDKALEVKVSVEKKAAERAKFEELDKEPRL